MAYIVLRNSYGGGQSIDSSRGMNLVLFRSDSIFINFFLPMKFGFLLVVQPVSIRLIVRSPFGTGDDLKIDEGSAK